MCNSYYGDIVNSMYSALGKAENHVRCGNFQKAAEICIGIVAQMVKHDLNMPDEAADGLAQDIQYVCRYYKAYYGSKGDGSESDKHDIS